MNKMIMTITLMGLFLVACTVQRGTSTDTIYGTDYGILWHHLYLKNDHSTVYCYDDFYDQQIQEARKANATVTVTYEKNILGKGTLCSAGEQYEPVVVTGVST